VVMRMIGTALAGGGSSLPLAGLTEFDLAFYDVPSPGAQGATLSLSSENVTLTGPRKCHPRVRGE
jgi:hypothetical protein